jgi:hypothetical protein
LFDSVKNRKFQSDFSFFFNPKTTLRCENEPST